MTGGEASEIITQLTAIRKAVEDTAELMAIENMDTTLSGVEGAIEELLGAVQETNGIVGSDVPVVVTQDVEPNPMTAAQGEQVIALLEKVIAHLPNPLG